MIVAVHQPQYLPWLGYFDKMRQADVFCFLDNVQYKKNDWQNRNRIKTAQGWQWLTVPVHYRFPQKINEVQINNTVQWQNKHLRALVSNYQRAPYFKEHAAIFEQVYSETWKFLTDLNIFLTERLRDALHLEQKTTIRASRLELREDPTDRLIDVCRAVGADAYLSGADGVKYMDLERFQANGIDVVIQDFKNPVYPQLFKDFQPQMSVVDLLFNCGPQSLEIIRRANP